MKVLIAEDDPISRRLLAATLTTFGFEVVCAVNGAEAWAGKKYLSPTVQQSATHT